MKLIVDVSSVVKTCLYAGKDREFGRQVAFAGKQVQVNSAQYGIDNAINRTLRKLEILQLAPRDMILVIEGRSSKALRTNMWEGYKADRAEVAPEVYEQVNKARDGFVQMFLDLGAQACTQAGVESDDVIAYLAKALPNCFIDSTDRDLQVLNSETAHTLNSANEMDQNGYGPFPSRYITLYKALVGGKDGIKGARGFGPAAFLDLYCMWGEDGLDAMIELIQTRTLERLVEDVGRLKSLQTILDDQQGVYLAYDLARLYPEKVNTYRNPLQWQVGMVKPKSKVADPRLANFYGRRKLVHAGNYLAALEWLRSTVGSAERISLDIETTSPMESDDWLELRKKRAPKDEEGARDLGVDVLGQKLVGMSLTFGDNDQFTHYFTVGHNGADGVANLTSEQVLDVVTLIPQTTPIIVHNSAFELSVLHREWQSNAAWQNNGWHGFLPNTHDTKLLSSYVNENSPSHSLKPLSKSLLGYDQVTFAEVSKGRKMSEMTATETFDYGCDDAVCTIALYNHFKTICEIEKTWATYLEVEQMPAYMDALRFNQGTPISMEELLKQERDDQYAYNLGWAALQDYLISKGWEGTVCPQLTSPESLTPAFVKEAYAIVTGEELKTQVRTISKLGALIGAAGHHLLERLVLDALLGDVSGLNEILRNRFNGEVQFNLDSPVQCCRLLYEVMGLPPRVFNKRTDKQRAAGALKGNPKGDDLAIQYALLHDVKPDQPEHAALKALQAMKVANTKRKMFYEPYKTVCHWTDGLVHAYFNQCAAVTRRYSSSGPNLQQMPKHAKSTGEPPKFRRVIVPHHRRAVVVSMDFSGQELRLIAERSQDANLLACFVGDNLKDVHALTAAGILKKKALARRMDELWTMSGGADQASANMAETVLKWKDAKYEDFIALESGPWAKLYKNLRALGKKTNFTTEFGAMAPKLAETMIISVEEAQDYIDAKEAAFPRVGEWKSEMTAQLHKDGYTTTLMQARRHLAPGLLSGNGYEIGGAERQGINSSIQGSACEQIKLAMARIWKSDLLYRMDVRFIGPVHDELVFSVNIDCLVEFLTEAHALMIAPYGGMSVPIVSSVSLGLNYGDQIEVGDTVDPQRINDVLYRGYVEGDTKKPALFPSPQPRSLSTFAEAA